MSFPHVSMPERPSVTRSRAWYARDAAPLAALLLAAASLRLYRLNSQFWFDEISALINNIRRPFADILLRWAGPSSHALFEALSHASITAFGETPFAARLPAALFGIASVWAIHALAADILERRHAWTIAGLFALSYHHVFYSQNARGYTALIFFFLVASRVVIRAWDTGRLTGRDGIGYTLAVLLAAWSQFVGVLIIPAQALVMAGAWLFADRGRRALPVRSFMIAALAAALLAAAVFAPAMGRLPAARQANVSSAAEGPRLGAGLVAEFIEGLSAAFHGPLGLAVVGAIGIIGLVTWWRRHPFSLTILGAPIALQLMVYAALGIGIHPRYLMLALPVGFMVGGVGIVTAVEALTRRIRSPGPTRRRVEYVLLGAVVLASAMPLRGYYRVPRQDFLGAAAEVERLSGPGDSRVAVQLVDRAINRYYGRNWLAAETLEDLAAIERRGGRIYVVTTLEGLLQIEDPALVSHLRNEYQRIATFPGTVGDGTVHIYYRELGGR